MSAPPFVPDPSRYVPIDPRLKCGEEWTDTSYCDDDDDCHRGPITFHVMLPQPHDVRLNFNCQDKSSGVLLPSEPAVSAEDAEDGPSDPFFFERGFYLEAKTGFQPWPGARLMVEAFTCMESEKTKDWQTRLTNKDLNVLEVGAGIGLVGTCLAAAGGRVLISDLPVLVEHGIRPNVKRNANAGGGDHAVSTEFLDALGSTGECTRVGDGCARAIVLDWFKPVEDQLPRDTSSAIDVIIACDCMFLRALVEPLLSVVSTLFQISSKSSPKFLFTFQRRNMTGVFTGVEELLELVSQRGWKVECLAWRTIDVEGDGKQDLYLFEVSPESSRNNNQPDEGETEEKEERPSCNITFTS